ncbi:MAG: hypothetical protein JW917_03670 [Ignavibacteria bacterium]|nr:hypothetical protein [Ignavibacteria bacterium]
MPRIFNIQWSEFTIFNQYSNYNNGRGATHTTGIKRLICRSAKTDKE